MVYLVRFLEFFSEKQPVAFSYIPKVYLTTFLDSFHVVRRGDPPFDFGNDLPPPPLFSLYLKMELTNSYLSIRNAQGRPVGDHLLFHYTLHRSTRYSSRYSLPLTTSFQSPNLSSLLFVDFKKELLQSLAELLKYPLFVKELEHNEVARLQLLPMLLNAFLINDHNNNHWITIAPMLPALWKVHEHSHTLLFFEYLLN